MRWTDIEELKLKKYGENGLPAWLIAKKMERSVDSITAKAKRMGISIHNPSEFHRIAEYRGVISREECGGSIGRRYFPADRSGGSFHTGCCDILVATGHLVPVDGGWVYSE